MDVLVGETAAVCKSVTLIVAICINLQSFQVQNLLELIFSPQRSQLASKNYHQTVFRVSPNKSFYIVPLDTWLKKSLALEGRMVEGSEKFY